MSDEEKPLEFSARDLMPDWAQEKPQTSPQEHAKRFAADDDDRGKRRGGGRRDERRDGFDRPGGRGPRRDFGDRGRDDRRRDDRPRGDRPRGDQGRGGPREGGPRGDRRGGPRREDRFREGGAREQRPREERAADGVVASLEPSGPAVEGLTKHIRETFRSFPVADLAKMILEARERYRVRFTATEPVRLHQCLADASLWLTRDEAIGHVLSSPALEQYYVVEDVATDPPSGNFSVIAVCGMSGVVLGPPNHHEYQRNIARLHRDRFSDMSLERYKSRIRMESGEEILEKWKEQASRVRQYRVKPADFGSPEVAPAEEAAEVPTESEVADAVELAEEDVATPLIGEGEEAEIAETASTGDEEVLSTEEVSVAEEIEASEPTEEAGEVASDEPAAAAVAEEAEEVFRSLEEVGRHFRQHLAEAEIVVTSVAVVPGNVAGRHLSPGLLLHLKQETEKLRRTFPLPLIQSLCQEFERRGLKFFKRGKKSLHVAAVRPKAIDETANLTDAIRAIVEYVKNAPKPTVSGLLEVMVPDFKHDGPIVDESADHSDEARAVLKDLRWLTAEGYVLEFADTGLAIGRAPQAPAEPPKAGEGTKEKAPKKKREKAAGDRTPAVVETAAVAEEAVAEAEVTEEAGGLAAYPLEEGETDPDDPYDLPESVNPVDTF